MDAIDLKRRLFKKAVIDIVENGQYNTTLPRSFFIKTIIKFRKKGGAIFLRKSSIGTDYLEWEILFLEILDELKINVKPGVLGKRTTIVTPDMMRGARKAQLRHDRVLKYDT